MQISKWEKMKISKLELECHYSHSTFLIPDGKSNALPELKKESWSQCSNQGETGLGAEVH